MTGSVAGLRTAKKRCRRETLARRSHLPGDLGLTLGALALSHLFRLPEYRAARTVMAFASFRDELQTGPLLTDVLRSGRVLVLPVTRLDTRRLDPRIVSDLTRLRPGVRGIPEPDEDCPPADAGDIDLVVVPGVAYDCRGHRVGYGGGFYDGLLRAWRVLRERCLPGAVGDAPTGGAGGSGNPGGGVAPVACGLAYELQVYQTVPSGAHDQPVDMLVTESGVRRFGEGWR